MTKANIILTAFFTLQLLVFASLFFYNNIIQLCGIIVFILELFIGGILFLLLIFDKLLE